VGRVRAVSSSQAPRCGSAIAVRSSVSSCTASAGSGIHSAPSARTRSSRPLCCTAACDHCRSIRAHSAGAAARSTRPRRSTGSRGSWASMGAIMPIRARGAETVARPAASEWNTTGVSEVLQLPGWRHKYSGKVRDLYVPDDGAQDVILVVASDRISAYDHVLPTPIPDKGAVLTALSLWWFEQLSPLVPNH